MKKVLYLVIFIFSYTAIFAQAPAIEWQNFYGGSLTDAANSIIATQDGGYIIAGYTNSKNFDVSGRINKIDYWIVKIDQTGQIQWQKCFGGDGDDYARSIIQTKDSCYLIAGVTNSNDSNVTGFHGYYDVWVLKIDQYGKMLWQKCYGGQGNDQVSSIIETKDGGYIVAGSTSSMDGDVTGNHGQSDAWILKIDDAGQIQWQKNFGGTVDDIARSIIEAKDGGYIFTGWTDSWNGDVTANKGFENCWVVKLNQSGDLQWQKCYGNSEYCRAYSIIESDDENFIIAGTVSSTNDGDVKGNHGSFDFWTAKINQTGKLLWQKCLGGSNYDNAVAITKTKDMAFLVVGNTKSNNDDVSGCRGDFDYWVVKINQTGNLIWVKCLGGTLEENAASIIETKDGGCIVAGTSKSMDDDMPFNHGASDFLVVKLSPETAVNEPEPTITDNISISPNPASNIITIKCPVPGNNLVIYNIYGQQVFSSASNDNEITIDVSGFAPGAYAVAIGSERRMFIKE